VLLRLEPADGLRQVVAEVGALEPDFVSVDVSHHGGTSSTPLSTHLAILATEQAGDSAIRKIYPHAALASSRIELKYVH
jgi:hypothetical protein